MVKRYDDPHVFKTSTAQKKTDETLADLAVAVSIIYLQSAYFNLYTFLARSEF